MDRGRQARVSLTNRALTVKEVRAVFEKEGTCEQVARFFNIRPNRVGSIKRGETHGQFTGKKYERKRKDRLALRRAVLVEPYDRQKLAKEFDVSVSTVKRYRAQETKRMFCIAIADGKIVEKHEKKKDADKAFWMLSAHELKNGRKPLFLLTEAGIEGDLHVSPSIESDLPRWARDVLDRAGL